MRESRPTQHQHSTPGLAVVGVHGYRRVAASLLKRAGYVVHQARNGREALERVASGVDIDLVVTDAVMPEMGGIELLRRLRALDLRFGAVVCSGYAEEICTADLDALDASFLPKPYAADALLSALDAITARTRRA